MDEDRATLDYAHYVHGTGPLDLWVILADGSMLETDVSAALHGSGTWQSLPSASVRLLVRRPLESASAQFRFAAISLSVLYARSVDVEVFDDSGRVVAQHTVRKQVYYTTGVRKGKGSPYSITERRVPELIPVLGSQPAVNASHKPLRGLLPILLLGEQGHDGCEQFA